MEKIERGDGDPTVIDRALGLEGKVKRCAINSDSSAAFNKGGNKQ